MATDDTDLFPAKATRCRGQSRTACSGPPAKRERAQEEERDYGYYKRSYQRVERQIALSSDADAAKMRREVKNGVLNLTSPQDKTAEERKQRITVEAD